MKFKYFLLLTAPFLMPGSGVAAPAQQLTELINAYRADPPVCQGKKTAPLTPLVPDARLSDLKIAQPGELPQAMQVAGYRARRAEAISVTGPSDAQQAFQFVAKNDCRLLLSPHYSVIGVSQRESVWQMVFAQPLLSADLGAWQAAGQQVLKLVNYARARPRTCGEQSFQPAQPLRWNATLAAAALKHSQDMARHQYFAHEGRDGSSVATRAKAEGYAWRNIGENIAAGQGSAAQVVEGWLASPGHCANIMNGSFSEMGAAYVYDAGSEAGIYWTQVLGRER